MIRDIKFTKMVATGNDFIIILDRKDSGVSYKKLTRLMCDRNTGVGADGLLIVQKPSAAKADVNMRIFNADGSEAEMCGNGARCVAFWTVIRPHAWVLLRGSHNEVNIKTKAGIIHSKIYGDSVKIKLTPPAKCKLDVPIKINKRPLKVNFINTGVPHTVVFVKGIEDIDVCAIGRQIRYHPKFRPAGTNVDFVEVMGNRSIRIRTYERGVEDETLACGTGAVASALITALRTGSCGGNENFFNVLTKSNETLKVYYTQDGSSFKDVWLDGKVRMVYKGVYYV